MISLIAKMTYIRNSKNKQQVPGAPLETSCRETVVPAGTELHNAGGTAYAPAGSGKRVRAAFSTSPTDGGTTGSSSASVKADPRTDGSDASQIDRYGAGSHTPPARDGVPPLDFAPRLPHHPNPWALLPLGVFLVSYLLVSILAGDFYKMPITVAFLIASATAIGISKGGPLSNRIEQFCRGAGGSNIMLMVLIFILAGAFAQTAKTMGAVDATVNLAMSLLPENLLAAGIFIAACFISLSVGTSVGTIVALAPVAVGIASKTGMPVALMLGVVVSGAMFGDNLSFISDTTIVATRTQGCRMSDKFKVNIRIALPVALVTAAIYMVVGSGYGSSYVPEEIEWIKVVPYLVVLATAIAGVHVMLVLAAGILLSGLTGLWTGSFSLWGWNAAMGSGIMGMGELIIVTLLAGGMLEMIRYNGGIDWIVLQLTRHIRSRRGAEGSIAALVGFANLCTANNTIALIMAGPIARDIAGRFGIDPRRSASILDIFSCFVQGIIPYGAQLLMASGLGGVSPIEIMGYLYYPYLLGAGGVLAILANYPRRFGSATGPAPETSPLRRDGGDL